ncbi:MAG: ParA family protein [Candidatus Marinimicrobia bacterium]|nr:ParA family protein [Candidatus Neomarinimicrobiota bacterium]
MAKIIVVVNQKGGVGKTTSAVNIAAGLGAMEIPTLLIDLDPQANATTGFGIQISETETSIYEALLGHEVLENTILTTSIRYLDIAPSSQRLVGAEVEMVGILGREQILKNAIEPIKQKYEFILIDCPPSLGLLTINALTAGDSVLIPIQCEYYALEGFSQLLNTIGMIRKSINPRLAIEGVLVTMFDSRLNLSKQVTAEVRDYFGDKMYKTMIKRNVRLGEAPSHGKPIILYDAMSTGAQNYMALVEEMLNGQEKVAR